MDITSVSNATIIVNSAPIFVAILSFIFFKERLTKGFLLSFLVTYIGIVGLIYFSNNYVNGKLLGDILCLIAAFFYGVYLLVIARLGKENSLNIIFYTTFFCCLFSIIPMMIEGGNLLPSSSFEWFKFNINGFFVSVWWTILYYSRNWKNFRIRSINWFANATTDRNNLSSNYFFRNFNFITDFICVDKFIWNLFSKN